MCQTRFDFNDNPRRQVLLIIPMVHMRKLSYREVKHHAQSWDSNQGSIAAEFMCVNTKLYCLSYSKRMSETSQHEGSKFVIERLASCSNSLLFKAEQCYRCSLSGVE